MSTQVLNRRQQPVTYTGSGNKQVIQLNKGLIYRQIALRLTHAVTLTAANNTPALTQVGDEWGAIAKVELIANGSDVMFSMSGENLWWYNYHLFPDRANITTTIGDSATANPAIDSVLIIPFWSKNSAKGSDTWFYSGEVTDFRLEITWANYTNVNSSATGWTTQPNVEVQSIESALASLPPLLGRTITYVQLPTGANPAFRFPLDVGPLYRGFIFNAKTGGSDTAGLFSNVKLVSGSTVFCDISESMLAKTGREMYGISHSQIVQASGVAYQAGPKISTGSKLLGWYNLDLIGDGYLTEAINSANLSELYLEFNMTAAATITLLARQLISLNRPVATPTTSVGK